MTEPAPRNRIPRCYWILAALLTGYVALCTGQRDNMPSADAWEHHRAIKNLAGNLWNPGNPTYATDHTSIRYTPYAVFWALVSRVSGIDPYNALSIAAVANTVLLFAGVAALLKSFGEGASATAGLLIMLGLYGTAPGHSSSYAFSDLPWHQVNHSAFAFALTLVIWALFKRFECKEWKDFSFPLLVFLPALPMLDHVMTGILTQLVLWGFVLAAETQNRRRMAIAAFLISLATLLLCLVWPWYPFLAAMTMELPPIFVNRGVHRLILTMYCVPAIACGLFALVFRDRKLVRVFLAIGYVVYGISAIVYFLPQGVPAVGVMTRMPLPGLIFFHLALGVFAYRSGLLDCWTWAARVRKLWAGATIEVPRAATEIVLTATVAYFLIPQLMAALETPYLARAYIAPVLGKENKQLDLYNRYQALLEPVGPRDVVFSDARTSWPVPSLAGRIVFALHPELFVPDQVERSRDVLKFFTRGTTDDERIVLLDKYGAKWLLLNTDLVGEIVSAELMDDSAVVKRDRELVLLDAAKWKRRN